MIPDDAWPKGDRLTWDDDATLTHYDFSTDPYTLTPYTDPEVTEAQERRAITGRQDTLQRLKDQLAGGVTDILAARAAALADQSKAETLQIQAIAAKSATLTQRQAVAGFVPAATYSSGQLGQIRGAIVDLLSRMEDIQQALADFYAYRAQVDENAVTTDDALLWLARLASGVLENDQTPEDPSV